MAGVGIATGFGRFTYALLLPAMTADVLGSYGRAGFLGTVNLGAYLAGLLVVSALAGRVSPVRLFLVGLSGSVAGMAILAIAPGFGVLVIGMALTGVSAAGVVLKSSCRSESR
ncbi:MAG: YbfB/YjiJ family MFS transporter, partial [Acidimicrobiia bacterium]